MNIVEAARNEYAQWCKAVGVDTRERLNEIIKSGEAVSLINLCEARQERQYAQVADQIFWKRKSCRIVMMSGPSSSGKTSSSLRIAQQAKVIGINPKVIELDNYFRNREDTPRDEKGEYDFEALGAMDVEFLGEQLDDLLAGKEIKLAKYDFKSGTRKFNGEKMQLKENDMLFMEGIHALNPALCPNIDQEKIFKIYISALSTLPAAEVEHYSTTDKRLLRRIVRDNRTRGISPEANIMRWPSVRNGEVRNIFPYEDNANVVFNSSTIYDLPLLKYYAEPLLYEIKESSPAYEKAQSLIAYLDNIVPLRPSEIACIPPTSIMREFIGGQML